MDWTALRLSLALAGLTCVLLIPVATLAGRHLAMRTYRGKGLVEAAVALPLVLPPTVLGYYLLVAMGRESFLGQFYEALVGRQLVFTFDGLLAASLLVNLPFAVQPLQRAFETIHPSIREAAWCSGLSAWSTLWRIELPLVWPGLVTATALTFVHTLGEFGVVLMIGGNIPGETQTVSIAIYDRVQAFDDSGAATMAALLLALSFVGVSIIYGLAARGKRGHG